MTEKTNIKLNITGMTCDSCAVHVEKALASVPGVEKVVLPSWDAGFASVVADMGVAPTGIRTPAFT
jgi:mercuric reductase